MKPLRGRLEDARKNTGLPWEVIERDYVLSWMLAGIAAHDELHDTLVFKGGTALKKCYFGDYRFSEDLDFTATEKAPRRERLEKGIGNACRTAMECAGRFSPLDLRAEKYEEKEPHPGGQEAFVVKGRLPWHRRFLVKAKIEITFDEDIKTEPASKEILHGYGERIGHRVRVYSLEEIVAEKMRALLQHLHAMKTRGWSRSRARDYYDLWRILTAYRGRLNMDVFPGLFLEKCKVRNVVFSDPEGFFDQTLIDYVGRTWEQWLGPLVPDLPPFALVIDELRPKLFEVLR